MSKLIKGFVIGVIVTLILVSAAQVIAEMVNSSTPRNEYKLVSPNGVIWQLHVDNAGVVYTDSIGCYQ